MRAEYRPRRACGLALVPVCALLLVSGLAVMGVARFTVQVESGTGQAADQARAFAAAGAVLRDAEADVAGAWPDGSRCGPPDADAGCRKRGTQVLFPEDSAGMDALSAALQDSDPELPCRQGICLRIPHPPKTPFVPQPDTPGFARYGEFTGAGPTPDGYLGAQARYWVEVLGYIGGADPSPLQPDRLRPYVFRITAAVEGLRPDSRVVLQEVFVSSSLSPPP